MDQRFFGTLVAEERKLKEAVAKNPEWQKSYGGAWDGIAKAVDTFEGFRKNYSYLELGSGFSSDLFRHARTLVRAAEERPKPIEKRFREFRDSAIPAITQRLFSQAPIHDELEIATLTFALTKLREELGTDDPAVKKVLGKESPEELASRLVKGTKLKDVAARKALWEGGKKAVDASTDPLIKFAKLVDPEARAVRKRYEDKVEAPMKKNAELLAKARFAIYGTSAYPDATFTLRLSYGQVKGWQEPGKTIRPFTTMAGAFDRATGRPPFELPPSWLAARTKIKGTTPVQLRHHQRHHRRQLGIAGGQQGRRGGGPDLRRQHPLAGRRLRLRRDQEPVGGRAQRGHHRGAGEDLRRRPAGQRAAPQGHEAGHQDPGPGASGAGQPVQAGR